MNKITKLIAFALLGCFASQAVAIKLTNLTNDTLLYCCGNPTNKNVSLQKYELKSKATVEITETKNYVQIYDAQKPQMLKGKYPLADQTQDLSIVSHPMFGYVFKTAEELNSASESKQLPSAIMRSLYGMPNNINTAKSSTQKPDSAQPALSSNNASKKRLTHMIKDRPVRLGRQRPTKRKHQQEQTQQEIQTCTEDNQNEIFNENAQDSVVSSSEITIETSAAALEEENSTQDTNATPSLKKENKQSIYKRYLTKKSLALGLTLGTIGAVVWWWSNFKGFNIGF